MMRSLFMPTITPHPIPAPLSSTFSDTGFPRRDSSISRGAGPFSMRLGVFSEDKTVLEERWSRAKLHTIANGSLILVEPYQNDEIAIC
jgi:predicted DNA-binding ribbon-helix-helix protein